MMIENTRRHFLKTASLYSLGFLGLRELAGRPAYATETFAGGFGPLVDDPAGIIRLPAGFRYTVFSKTGERMTDGFFVPGRHDGMAAFPGPDGKTILVRNHEIESAWKNDSPFGPANALLDRVPPSKIYDRGGGIEPNLGGTTTLVFDTATQTLETHFLSLAGTVRNCAGGPTPWGTWITCEEVNDDPEQHAEKLHGYNFEVPAFAEPGLVDPIPLKAMGRFRHEAVAIHPNSGAVYQTEDIGDGLLYRFLPNQPGKLAAGGRLQALAIRDWKSADTRNWSKPAMPVGKAFAVDWIDVEDIDNPKNDLRLRGAKAGAAVFARGEGAWWGNDAAYFAMTMGGQLRRGQVFSYRPSPMEGTAAEKDQPGSLELFIEPNDSAILSHCDNLAVAPWGDLILCEDTDKHCRLIGVTPEGRLYAIAQKPQAGRELAGACFSADGSTLFVNVQSPGYTLAITGPWGKTTT